MKGGSRRGLGDVRWEMQLHEGWQGYQQALELLDQSEWEQALVLFAEAEITFRAADDQHGLWRALIGQALLHWRDGAAALAIARGLAALRAALASEDRYAIGCVSWQLANIMIGLGRYREAAEHLTEAQLAFDAADVAPPGGLLAAAAQLCNEILRWQKARDRGQLGAAEAEGAIAEAHHELLDRLKQVAATLQGTRPAASPPDGEDIFLSAPPALSAPAAREDLGARLSRWWRALTGSDPELARSSSPQTALPAPDDHSLGERPAELRLLFAPQVDVAPPVVPPAEDEVLEVEGTYEWVERGDDEAVESRPPERALAVPPAALADEPAPLAMGAAPPEKASVAAQGLAVYCFGGFRAYYDDTLVERWESARGRAIFKYLVTRRSRPTPKEWLADLFWPDSEPELARRSLHQAIYCLRQTFKRVAPDLSIIHFADGHYQINPAVPIWVDFEGFAQAIEQARGLRSAQPDRAAQTYGVAVDLYSGEFLKEERYEDWTSELRQTYQAMHREALHYLARHHQQRGEQPTAIMFCQRALAQDSCDEEAYRLLMECYLAQGLRHLAVRQYQLCVNALKTELGISPSDELEGFYQRVVAAR